MRLVAWNANYNNQRRSLEDTVALLEPLHADILVLSETAQFSQNNPLCAQWFGAGNPGLAIVAREGLKLTEHPANSTAPRITAGFEVSGELRFNLVAAWPVKAAKGESYHQILMATLEHYAEMFKGTPAIFAGDLNSSTRVSNQRRTHRLFVEHARVHGLESAYHFQTGELHGEETIGTYCHRASKNSTFHLDYCFVSSPLADCVSLRVLNSDEWSRRSDHYPVVLDVADHAVLSKEAPQT